MRFWGALAGAVLLGGCATPPAPKPGIERISYHPGPGPFCGRCTSSTLTVDSDGKAWLATGYWAGHYRDRRSITRKWTLAPGQFERFREALAPLRPLVSKSFDEEGCPEFWTDGGEIRVEWQGGGPAAWLSWVEGCRKPDAERANVEAVLKRAPGLVGVRKRAENSSVLLAPDMRELRQAPAAPTSPE